MNVSTALVRLRCILVDDKLVVRNSPFNISVPSEEEIGEFINYVKNAMPSVRDKDHGKFSFYQPPLDCPIRVTESLPGSQLTRKDLGTLLLIPFTVGEVFQEKGADRRFDIDVIVHLDYGENGGGVVLHTLRVGSSNTWLRHITFHLRNRDEAQLPPETELDTNNISEFSADSDGALPDFIEQLEQELRLRRSPRHDIASVKAHLGDDTFGEHFTDVNDGSETHRVTDIELLHYLDALIDRNLSNQAAYRNRTESHVYSLLRRFAVDPLSESPRGAKLSFDAPWIFGLAVKTRDNQILHQYTPHSDVFFSIGGFPHVLLKISSDKKKRDHCRMLLQASHLVRLGNMLISDKSPTFFVKAFYIDNDYNADEFTLYQRHHESGPGDDKVEYHKDSHVLSDKHAMFKFVFRIYNLLHPIVDLHARLTPQMGTILSSILTETETFPFVMGWRKRGAEDGASDTQSYMNILVTTTDPHENSRRRARRRVRVRVALSSSTSLGGVAIVVRVVFARVVVVVIGVDIVLLLSTAGPWQRRWRWWWRLDRWWPSLGPSTGTNPEPNVPTTSAIPKPNATPAAPQQHNDLRQDSERRRGSAAVLGCIAAATSSDSTTTTTAATKETTQRRWRQRQRQRRRWQQQLEWRRRSDDGSDLQVDGDNCDNCGSDGDDDEDDDDTTDGGGDATTAEGDDDAAGLVVILQ
ncbi:hypothetical protein EDB85DRAFT_2280746 [Lactarius pseudohatsudake]|nr:hypothetical protein EDB85DRAFT_2280746 [Lactarius pseudohatsudake]